MIRKLLLSGFICLIFSNSHAQVKQTALPISAPVTLASPGKMGSVAQQSVMRIFCTKTGIGGSAFLHKSGWIITAAHVVMDCSKNDLVLVLSTTEEIKLDSIISDTFVDLAALKPFKSINLPALEISEKSEITAGSLVTTWGFPSGYNGSAPLLTVGYLSGVDRLHTASGLSPSRWVVNAAFNGGNSGGPVLEIETGAVIGVVSSKLAPIPPMVESEMDALAKQTSGFGYTKTLADGTTQEVTEGQVVAEILKYLRSQTQLVLGHAVTSNDLIHFLQAHGITN